MRNPLPRRHCAALELPKLPHHLRVIISFGPPTDAPLRPGALKASYGAFAKAHPLLLRHGCQNADSGFFEDARRVKVLLGDSTLEGPILPLRLMHQGELN
jgi:hypothetical protein